MNIKRAKKEIRDTIEAYLAKDEFGEYQIPEIRQRPILLMGPPGIGKTQIMEQIAKECHINLVAYTITHHTRQSAVGLPFIKEKKYGNVHCSVTEYTMSEIISAVYEKIEKTKIHEGILFIDEINCVSETLAPMMLQFLQGKTFGNQKVPKGWIIVTAGNPPEYNKSVREFDVVTLDRIKRIDVRENLEVWREYAYRQKIHPAIISYLELRREHFYRVENTVDGKMFVTARGWEDLSSLILVYEKLGKTLDREVVAQYLQHEKIAKDFANYLELYDKYRTDYGVEGILEGSWNAAMLQKIKNASFDERFSIVSLLNGKIAEALSDCYEAEQVMAKLYEYLLYYRENQKELTVEAVWKMSEKDKNEKKNSEQLTKEEEKIFLQVNKCLEEYLLKTRGKRMTNEAAYLEIKELFGQDVERHEAQTEASSKMLENAFQFLEDAFGESQEMVSFVTELNANYYSMWFIRENGCALYDRYNKELLFDKRQKEILGQMDSVEELLNNGIK